MRLLISVAAAVSVVGLPLAGLLLKRLCFRFGFFAIVAGIVITPLGAAEFIQTYGSVDEEFATSIVATADGGFAVAGGTRSFFRGLWVLKLDATGNVVFEKTYGGSTNDIYSMIQTADGGFAVAGGNRFRVLKLDATGNVVFDKDYSFLSADRGRSNSIVATTEGGFAVAGRLEVNHRNLDFWVLKLDAIGNVVFEKTYGGPGFDEAGSIVATTEGGFAVAGVTTTAAGDRDSWVLKLDATGNVVFEKTYGGPGLDNALSIVATADGGFAVAGDTRSFGAGGQDAWVLKLDATGNVVFEKAYGGPGRDQAFSIVGTADGGFAVAGLTTSFGPRSVFNAWVLKLDTTGNVVFEKTYGTIGRDAALSIVATTDGGFGVAGFTTFHGAGGMDFWVLKLDAMGEVPACGLGVESHAIVTETSAIVQTLGVEGVASAAIVRDTAAMVTDTMSLVERQCGVTCEPRGLGFWKHQCSGQGLTQVSSTEMADHFLNLEAGSPVFDECAPSDCAALLDGHPKNDMRRKAEQHSLALGLNIASGQLDLACPADTDQTVADILATMEPVLCDAQASKADLEIAKDLAEAANEGGDDLELVASETLVSGTPGTTLSVPVTLINMSATTRDYSLTVYGSWNRPDELDPIDSMDLPDDSLPLEVTPSAGDIQRLRAGDIEFVTLLVTIPANAQAGESGSILLTALDEDSPEGFHRSLVVGVTVQTGAGGGGKHDPIMVKEASP